MERNRNINEALLYVPLLPYAWRPAALWQPASRRPSARKCSLWLPQKRGQARLNGTIGDCSQTNLPRLVLNFINLASSRLTAVCLASALALFSTARNFSIEMVTALQDWTTEPRDLVLKLVDLEVLRTYARGCGRLYRSIEKILHPNRGKFLPR